MTQPSNQSLNQSLIQSLDQSVVFPAVSAVHPPLLTQEVIGALLAARAQRADSLTLSLDLQRSQVSVTLQAEVWCVGGQCYPYPSPARERTVYAWDGQTFTAVARYNGALIKLVPTTWGPPTFEIDGIKMLPTAKISPWVDAANKVALIEPQGKRILDCCGGLGYFAVHALAGGARRIDSFEKNADVIWLREQNAWSPEGGGFNDGRLVLRPGDVAAEIQALPAQSYDAVLHDPPRFGIAGELYALSFYEQLARVLVRKGRLFHYTGTPNKLTSGRDVPKEVARRLSQAGFTTHVHGDGILASKR